MNLRTLLKGLAIVLLPGGLTIAIAYWAMTRRKK